MKVTSQKAINFFNMRIKILATFRNLPAIILFETIKERQFAQTVEPNDTACVKFDYVNRPLILHSFNTRRN
jgi:hypothetical protein